MSRTWKIPTERKYLRAVLAGKTDPQEIARTLRMKLEDFITWTAQVRATALLQGLRHLGDMTAQLKLSQARTAAIVMLTNMAEQAEGNEPLRRVCADLVRTVIVDPPVARELLEALNKLGPKVLEKDVRALMAQIGREARGLPAAATQSPVAESCDGQ